MKGLRIEIALWLAFSIMQSGPVIGSMEYGSGEVPMSMMLMMVPFSLMVLGVVLLTTRYAMPRLLMRQEWGKYMLFIFTLSYILSFIEQGLTRYMWVRLDIIPDGTPVNWGGMALNSLSNSLMLGFTLLAVGVWGLVKNCRKDLILERSITEEIENYIAAVKGRLNPDRIISRVGKISDEVITEPEKAEEEIAGLCSELREDLYHLPTPPNVETLGRTMELQSPFNRWLTGRQYRLQRFAAFQLALITICFGAFFATPDQPEFASRLAGFLILTAIFEILAGIVVYILFPIYRRRRKVKVFVILITLLAALVLLPIIVERTLLFKASPGHTDSLFIFITIFATIASMLMIIFFLGGVSAVLLYSDWVKETRRITLLKATTRRLEYSALKKQINPHFLFNVLNNAMVKVGTEPGESRALLIELQRLLRYQLHEADREWIPLTDTLQFLRDYLELESTRKEAFRYSIEVEGEPEGIDTPTLIFIPFVENAVKYSYTPDGTDEVELSFSVGAKKLRFDCRNTLTDPHPGQEKKEAGREKGIGVANTLRRLEIIYDNRISYKAGVAEGHYVMELEIPIIKN